MLRRFLPWILVALAVLAVVACRLEESMSAARNPLDRPEIGQRLFHPRPDPAPADPARDAWATASDGTRLYVRLHDARPEFPTLLLFHGNGEVASDYDGLAPLLKRSGVNLAVAEFRGYGRSEGAPTASKLAGDAEAVFDFMRERLTRQAGAPRLVVMGRSLGSACALALAASRTRDVAGLVVESGFARTLPLLRTLGAPVMDVSEADGFGNLEHIKAFAGPTLVICGGEDTLIPPAEAHLLYDASPAQDKTLLVIPEAGHNDLLAVGPHEYLEAVAALAEKARTPAKSSP